MYKIRKVTIIIPCYNEAKGIGAVIDEVPRKKLAERGYSVDIIAIDNNSKDKTSAIARKKGAKVITELKQGKGYAIIAGFKAISSETNIVAMIDGDHSYDIRELPWLIEPIENDFADVIVGSRLHGKIADGSLTRLNRLGNWAFTFLARVGYKTNVTDVCSGFYVWKKEVIDTLLPHLKSNGFSIEMEMIAKMAKSSYRCYSTPISYNAREGKSSLRPIKDGSMILKAWFRNLFWEPYSIVMRQSEHHSIAWYKILKAIKQQ